MTMLSHLVDAKIAEARARGDLDAPLTDEARMLGEMAALLEVLRTARGLAREVAQAQLARCERALADILERTGQGVLADALWDESPCYDG